MTNERGTIKRYIKTGGFEEYYIDYNGDRFWYLSAHSRTTLWKSYKTGKTIKVLIYPYWSFLDNYINREVKIKLLDCKEDLKNGK